MYANFILPTVTTMESKTGLKVAGRVPTWFLRSRHYVVEPLYNERYASGVRGRLASDLVIKHN